MRINSFDNINFLSDQDWLFIINPKARKVNLDFICNELKLLNSNKIHSCYLFITQLRKHATSIAKEAINLGFRTIIAVGGDGTINEIINGIMTQNHVPSTDVYLGVIPAGTGNDWVKTYNFPHDLSQCLSILNHRKTFIQDIGVVTYSDKNERKKRYFNNVAGMAYDAFVVSKLEKRSYKPNRFIYLISVFIYLMKYKLQKASITTKNQQFTQKYYTINVGICKYSGGGMSLVPHAISDDGFLALTMAEDLSKWDILKNTYRFYNLSLLEHPKVHGFKVKNIVVESLGEIPIPLEVDGELLGTSPAEFSIIPRSLKIIIP